MATGQTSSTPSFFNFLKEGLLLPSHNRRLFVAVFTIIAASTCLLLLGYDLAVQPLLDEIELDTKALNSTDPSSSPDDVAQLIQKIQDDARALLLTGAASLALSIIIGSAIRLVVLFAAVATYSGELLTFGSLLGKVKTQLKGPVLTLAFVYALEIAYIALLVAMFVLLAFLAIKGHFLLLFVVWLLLLLPSIVFLVYFSFLGSLSAVVAVAEPGCHGAGALGRVWRLVKGKRRRAMLFVSVTAMLAAALTPIYTLAKRCALTNVGAGLLLGFLYSILVSAVQLFAACAMASFYYECKRTTEASAVEYVKVSTKEQLA